jgi:hypothetical protein
MAKSASKTINWTEGLIVKTFGLTKTFEKFPLLDQWLDVVNDLTPKDLEELEYRRWQLLKKVNSWNEETLKMKFIAFILDMVRYDTDELEGIFDAEMRGVVKGQKLSVIADYALAKMTFDLKEQPYFYFHEYKPRKQAKDPVAQLLLAMLIAQEKNEIARPLYGCVVIAENWYFMVIDGNEYAVSTPYVSTISDDLQSILLILRKFKTILLTQLAV